MLLVIFPDFKGIQVAFLSSLETARVWKPCEVKMFWLKKVGNTGDYMTSSPNKALLMAEIWRENHLGCKKKNVVNNGISTTNLNSWTPDFWTINTIKGKSPKMLPISWSLANQSNWTQPKKSPDPNRFEFGQEVWISQLILSKWGNTFRPVKDTYKTYKLWEVVGLIFYVGGFLKWWVSPTNPWVFLLKMFHFGVWNGGFPTI